MYLLDDRKSELLEIIIRDYIKTARPVASARLVEEYDLDMSSATVRSAMLELDRLRYLEQPHHAAGRVPTVSAYRFFVDRLEEDDLEYDPPRQVASQPDEAQDFFEAAGGIIAGRTQNLALGGWFARPESFRFFGLADALRQPEFEEHAAGADFVAAFEYLLNKQEELSELVESLPLDEPRVYIGRENPLRVLRDWSTVIARIEGDGIERGVVAVIGPLRMSYKENIALVGALARRLSHY